MILQLQTESSRITCLYPKFSFGISSSNEEVLYKVVKGKKKVVVYREQAAWMHWWGGCRCSGRGVFWDGHWKPNFKISRISNRKPWTQCSKESNCLHKETGKAKHFVHGQDVLFTNPRQQGLVKIHNTKPFKGKIVDALSGNYYHVTFTAENEQDSSQTRIVLLFMLLAWFHFCLQKNQCMSRQKSVEKSVWLSKYLILQIFSVSHFTNKGRHDQHLQARINEHEHVFHLERSGSTSNLTKHVHNGGEVETSDEGK